MNTNNSPVFKAGWIKRLATGALVPPILGTIILFATIMFEEPSLPDAQFLAGVVITLIFGFMFVGIQSVLISIAMEFLINPKVSGHNSVYALGVVMGLLSTFVFWGSDDDVLRMTITGAVVGGLTAWILRRMYTRQNARAA